jgi:hypothetical protein
VVAVVGWHRAGWWACCVGGAGRDLRDVGVKGGESVGARVPECALMLRAANPRVASVRSGLTRPVSQGLGRADGGRAVVTGCDEPLARGGGAVERGWPGLVWCKSGLPAGISRCQVCCWWAGGPRRLSHACHKWRETWWDAGRYAETIDAGRREGRDGLGRVNMASR